MDGRTTLFYKDGWTNDVVDKDGWMDERRCFIRMGWTDDVVL